MLIQLKRDLTIELALLHKDGIITVLPLWKHATPIFEQRKPNGRLHLLVDLKKVNSLIAEDYTDNNHPISTLSDVAEHLARKLFSASLIADCWPTVVDNVCIHFCY